MLAIVLPTYNERENLPDVIERIGSACAAIPHAIIVVDDSSPDGTGQVADTLRKKNKNIIVIHRKDRGRGTAGIRGFREALALRHDYVIEMDADLSHDPVYIPLLVREMRRCDIAVGSRFVKGGKIMERGVIRNVISRLGNLITRAVLGVEVSDIQSGYKCYRRRVLERLDFDSFISKGYSVGMETLYKAHKKGFSIREIPIVFRNRQKGTSKFSANEMVSYFINLFRVRLSA